MRTKQTIAVIGDSGIMQPSLLETLSRGNYRLLLCSKKQQKMLKLVEQIRATNPSADLESVECAFSASWEADIIISFASAVEEKEMAAKIEEVANQKIVISMKNFLVDPHNSLLSTAIKSAAEDLQYLLPNCKVVKVYYDAISTESLKPGQNGTYSEAIIAGEDKDSLDIVSELISTAGFNPIIATALRA